MPSYYDEADSYSADYEKVSYDYNNTQQQQFYASPDIDYTQEGWTLYYSDEGYPYYYNSITGESHWATVSNETEVSYQDDGQEYPVAQPDDEDADANAGAIYTYAHNNHNNYTNYTATTQEEGNEYSTSSSYFKQFYSNTQYYHNDHGNTVYSDDDNDDEDDDANAADNEHVDSETEIDNDEEERFQEYINSFEGQEALRSETQFLEKYLWYNQQKKKVSKEKQAKESSPSASYESFPKIRMNPFVNEKNASMKSLTNLSEVSISFDEERGNLIGSEEFDSVSSDDSDVELMKAPVVPEWCSVEGMKNLASQIYQDPVSSLAYALNTSTEGASNLLLYSFPPYVREWIRAKAAATSTWLWIATNEIAKYVVDGRMS